MVVGSTGTFGGSTMDRGANFWDFGSISVSLTLRTGCDTTFGLGFEIYKKPKRETNVSRVGCRDEILKRDLPRVDSGQSE